MGEMSRISIVSFLRKTNPPHVNERGRMMPHGIPRVTVSHEARYPHATRYPHDFGGPLVRHLSSCAPGFHSRAATGFASHGRKSARAPALTRPLSGEEATEVRKRVHRWQPAGTTPACNIRGCMQ